MVSISDIPTIKYWKNLGSMMDKAKEKITKKCRIDDTCFTALATIECNLYPNNPNRVHKDSNDLLPAIIIWGKNVYGGETFFYDG